MNLNYSVNVPVNIIYSVVWDPWISPTHWFYPSESHVPSRLIPLLSGYTHLASWGTRGDSSGKLCESVACQCRTFSLDAAMASSVRFMAYRGRKLRAVSNIRPLWRKMGASLSLTLVAMISRCLRAELCPLPPPPRGAGTRATSWLSVSKPCRAPNTVSARMFTVTLFTAKVDICKTWGNIRNTAMIAEQSHNCTP